MYNDLFLIYDLKFAHILIKEETFSLYLTLQLIPRKCFLIYEKNAALFLSVRTYSLIKPFFQATVYRLSQHL
jgi:hypothetical protein